MKTALFSPVLFIIIKKNMISFLFCISVFCIFPASLFAQGGQAGPLTWNINGSTLTISGEGEMPDYTHDNPAPWRDYVFNSTAIVIEYGVTSIGNWAFYTSHCGLGTTLISLPNSLTRIGDHAFHAMCTLKSITIPCSVTSIGLQAFSQSKLTSVTIPISVTYIGQGAFAWCYELTAIIIPNSITRIEHGICNGCNNLISITIPNSITSIGEMAFYGCNKLTTITLPSSIASIEMRIFENCTSLVSITNLNLIPINIYYSYNPVFAGVNQSACTLKVPTSAVSAYEDAEIWQNFNIVSGGILVYPKSNNSEYGYVTGNALYEANATATVTATAFTGYHFVNWTIDGEEVSTDNTYSFTVTEDVDLVANFEKILETFLVIVNSNNDEYGTATGSGLYEENKTVTVKATAYS
ncbi:MAG: leucine-rich repeat protein, partial [Lentimicrobiaceae bacterium]|nr:leucine-rich repeat protein [Lentimicrobiaceae bacterium]